MKITDRILIVLENKGITKYKFCKDLSFSNGFLDKSREISTDKYANILSYFDDINPTWLLTGKGEMLNDGNSNDNLNKKIVDTEIDKYEIRNKLLSVNEKSSKYNTVCESCIEKERVIKALTNQIELLTQNVKDLRLDKEDYKEMLKAATLKNCTDKDSSNTN
ncbi:MAG: hypothetical protein GQ564_23195 [Bacteroidales bacterium]|nr:hypothetical protein [Bacteroidales bacterium]